MRIGISASSLSVSRWYEYVIRFVLGGAATVITGLISSKFGASVGGLFLALPAIFCASATLIERHEIRRKRDAGLNGIRRGQTAAALDAKGAALGSFAMVAFAATFLITAKYGPLIAFVASGIVWTAAALATFFGTNAIASCFRRSVASSKRINSR